jgi:NUDIX domain-containing protein
MLTAQRTRCRLFRAPVLAASGEEMSEEACAGMIENEDADTTARREAYEELGDRPSLEFVARVWSSPGVSTERQSLFLAPYRSADRISDDGGVEGERDTVVERLLAELAADVDQGRIADGKLLTLVLAPAATRPLRLGHFFLLLLFARPTSRESIGKPCSARKRPFFSISMAHSSIAFISTCWLGTRRSRPKGSCSPYGAFNRKVGMSGGLFTNMLLRETRQEISPERVERLVNLYAAAYKRRSLDVQSLPRAGELLAYLTGAHIP